MSLAQLIFSCLLVTPTSRSCLHTMSSEAIDLTAEISLLEEITKDWIPLDGQSVPHLFQFTQYPPQHMLYHTYHDLSQQLHEEEVTSFQPGILLSLGPPLLHFPTATRLQSKQPHIPFTPLPWLQSLAFQSSFLSGY